MKGGTEEKKERKIYLMKNPINKIKPTC